MTAAYQNLPALELPLAKSYPSLIVDVTVNPPIVKAGTIKDLVDWDSLDTYEHDLRIGPIQWRPNAIYEKYVKKANAVMYDARAKCHNLQKKYDKLEATQKRMLEREEWGKFSEISDQMGDIVDEQVSIMRGARKKKDEYYDQIDAEIKHQRSVFEQLSHQYLSLMGKKDIPTNKSEDGE